MTVFAVNSQRRRKPPRSPRRETETNSTHAMPPPEVAGAGLRYDRFWAVIMVANEPSRRGDRRLIKPAAPLLSRTNPLSAQRLSYFTTRTWLRPRRESQRR